MSLSPYVWNANVSRTAAARHRADVLSFPSPSIVLGLDTHTVETDAYYAATCAFGIAYSDADTPSLPPTATNRVTP